MMTTTTARIYVGTYAKYNNGSIKGRWLDLEDYNGIDDFYQACRDLHADEPDPELMFQDWEGIPRRFIGESYLDGKVWQFLDRPEWEQDVLRTFWKEIDKDADEEQILEAYRGEYDSRKAFAEEYAEEAGYLTTPKGGTNPLLNYVDYERFWDGDLQHEFIAAESPSGVFIFNRNY